MGQNAKILSTYPNSRVQPTGRTDPKRRPPLSLGMIYDKDRCRDEVNLTPEAEADVESLVESSVQDAISPCAKSSKLFTVQFIELNPRF